MFERENDFRHNTDPNFDPQHEIKTISSAPPIVQLVIFLAVLFLLAVFACPMLAQGPPDPRLASATTDCGPRNTAYRIRWTEPFIYGDLESGRRRYGPCFGGGPLCSDLGGKCIETENEAALLEEWLTAIMAGRCDPPRGSLRPSIQTKHDWSYALLGNRSAMDLIRKDYQDLGCAGTSKPPMTAACPSGQTCQPFPAPACPSCSSCCPACPVCPPVASCAPSTGIPPRDVLLVIWDTRTTPPARRLALWIGDRYLLHSGAEVEAGKVSQWLVVPQ